MKKTAVGTSGQMVEKCKEEVEENLEGKARENV